jgi:prepilin-type N-terminal cleavage/methylation domain-containing protein
MLEKILLFKLRLRYNYKIEIVKKLFTKTKKTIEAGFTLIEMALVLGIFGVITAIVFFNYSSFNNQIVLGNLAYEIAMHIREAQVFSFGVRKENIAGLNSFQNSNYGVYFKKGQKSFFYFIDYGGGSNQNPNGKCDSCNQGTCTDECLRLVSLPRNMVIENIVDADNMSHDDLHITFKRPNPEAHFYSVDTEIITGKVEIIIKSPDNQYKKIIVRETGYISVASHQEED